MSVNRERKTVDTPVESFDVSYETLAEIRNKVDSLIRLYGEDAIIKMHSYPHESGEYPHVFVKRLETDEQMNARIREEEKWETQRIERDKREFERLSKQLSK